MKYLLDTDICIYLIHSKSATLLNNLAKKRRDGLAVSAITFAELEHGVENSRAKEKNRMALIELLSIFAILPFDDMAAQEYGKVKTALKKIGCIIGPLDILIGAHARSKGMVLVTNNTKEFQRIEDLEIENWI